MTVDELAEAIAALSVDEARLLVTALRTRLAVNDPLYLEEQALYRRGVLYGAPPQPDDERSRNGPQILVLEACGPNRATVITTICAMFSISTIAAKALVDATPCDLGRFDSRRRADDAEWRLRQVGAVVRLRPDA